jgi:AcrR family transcriptional regulator
MVGLKKAGATSKFEKKRAAITDVAMRHLNAYGVQGISLSEIAAELGMTKANLTYYFRRKDDIAAHCYNLVLDTYSDMIRDAEAGGTPNERIHTLIDNYFTRAAASAAGEAPPLAILGDVRGLNEPMASQTITHFSTILLATAALLETDAAAPRNLERTVPRAELLLMQLFWSAAWLGQYPATSYGRVVQRMHDIVVNGFAYDRSQWPEPLAQDARDLAQNAGGDLALAEFFRSATRMINERGYRGASLEKIAGAMEATKGAIYYQFASKHELVVACYERSFALMWSMISAIENQHASAWERLFKLVTTMVSFQASDRGPFLREAALVSLPPAHRQSMLRKWSRIVVHFSSLISDGIIDGSIRPIDPNLAAHVILAGINAADEVNRFAPADTVFDAAAHCARPILFGLLYDDPGNPPAAAAG